MFWIKKVLPCIISVTILILVIFYIEPPKSWILATPYQIALFFIPLLFSLIFLANIFLKSLMQSTVFGLGGMFLVTLLATNNLNWLTASLTILVTIFLIRIFPKSRLTRGTDFPKLTHIFKQND